jgi:hypothetical protein
MTNSEPGIGAANFVKTDTSKLTDNEKDKSADTREF